MKTWVNGEILNADKMNTLEQSVPASATSSNGVVTFKNGAGTDLFSVEISAPTQNDDSIYILRTLPYTSYLKQLQKIIGGTVAWNQLVQTNSASVNVPSGHKYLSRINGTNTIAISNGSAISINDGTKDNVFDLTAMFSSAIADYAYTLESGTAGAGIAWLKKYGYFTKPYYPYAAANLLSVKPSASKAISPDGNSYALYPFDSTIELRGLLKLDASNNLYYDGDRYLPDGTVARRYGIVDLSTVSMTHDGARWQTSAIPVKSYARRSSNLVSDKWIADVSATSGDTGKMVTVGGGVYFYTSDSTNHPTGYLVYELATPTTESSTPYIEHQACFPNGTEQFVDGRTVEMPVEAVAEYEVTS